MPTALDELHALWTEVFGEPPSIEADAGLLVGLLLRYLPQAPPYGEAERARGVDDEAQPAAEDPPRKAASC